MASPSLTLWTCSWYCWVIQWQHGPHLINDHRWDLCIFCPCSDLLFEPLRRLLESSFTDEDCVRQYWKKTLRSRIQQIGSKALLGPWTGHLAGTEEKSADITL